MIFFLAVIFTVAVIVMAVPMELPGLFEIVAFAGSTKESERGKQHQEAFHCCGI